MKTAISLLLSFVLAVLPLLSKSNKTTADIQLYKSIKYAPQVRVDCPVGTVPQLPYQLLVTCSDGHREWRQVEWMNYSRATEGKLCNPDLYPIGKKYFISGFILGDNTTDNGYPINAEINVVEENRENPQIKARPLPLSDVTLIGKNRLTNNRDRDIQNLLSLDITQQLYNYRDTYGLPTEGYTESDGWDSPSTKLKGHGTGHFMSALAFAYASSKDLETRSALKDRIKRMVDELRICQERTFVYDQSLGRYREARDYAPEEVLKDMKGSWEAFDEYKKDYQHYGYGYLNAIPAAHPALIEMYRPYNNEQWVWAPYYTIHKQLAGLIDIANNIDDEEISHKAFQIAHDMGLWVWNRLHYRTYINKEETKEDRQSRPGNRYEMWNMYIAGEVGGMAESLARLSVMTDDHVEKARLLEASNYFDSPAFFDPLSKNVDDIRTRHANQHIPMITGALQSYSGNHNPYYYYIADNFWNLIQGRYVYAMGGVGNGEMFRQPYSQMINLEPNINETCCAYNLAKLTKDLNCYNPDDARYMDYYERVLYNQLVGSLHPEHWLTTYQYAVGLNAAKEFGNETPQSSCCGGTGVENHVKYQEAAYFVDDNTLWIALYLPSEAIWREKGCVIRQECEWPAERSCITVAGGQFSLKLRVPYWATEGFQVKLNGRPLKSNYEPCSYVEIPCRDWHEGDLIEVEMPFATHFNYGPDKVDSFWLGTLMYGPLVMASSEISDWTKATFMLDSSSAIIENNSMTESNNTDGNVCTLSLNGVTFQPDYYQTSHSTHYLRLNLPQVNRSSKHGKIDRSVLEIYLQIAHERIEEESSWAPNGYRRMVSQLASSQAIMDNKKATQNDINETASALSFAINSMRPSTLAEPEDLTKLIELKDKIQNIPKKSKSITSAIENAEMVIDYVLHGSGTKDMINWAIQRIKQSMEKTGSN